jgi:hypothetical protein
MAEIINPVTGEKLHVGVDEPSLLYTGGFPDWATKLRRHADTVAVLGMFNENQLEYEGLPDWIQTTIKLFATVGIFGESEIEVLVGDRVKAREQRYEMTNSRLVTFHAKKGWGLTEHANPLVSILTVDHFKEVRPVLCVEACKLLITAFDGWANEFSNYRVLYHEKVTKLVNMIHELGFEFENGERNVG